MIDNKDGTVVLTYDELDLLLKTSEERLTDIILLRMYVLKVLNTIGLTTPDAKAIKPSIVNKTENPVKCIVKGGGKVIGLMIEAKFSKAAEKELDEMYSFLDNAIPIILKYGEQETKQING